MSIRYLSKAITTDGAGAATAYLGPVDGVLLAVRLVLGTWTGGAVDVTVTDQSSGAALLTVTNLAADTDFYPRGAAVSPANAAITNSFVAIPVSGQVKVVVAQGGATTTGTVHLWVQG